MVAAGRAAGHGPTLWIMGHTDLHPKPQRRRVDRPWVIKGAMDSEAFAAYVERVLVPELIPGTVVILENLATHKNAAAAKAMREAGCRFLFLPPYSPDLRPIEMAFSKLKAHLRKTGARTFTDIFNALTEICDLFSPEECWNHFKADGYVSGQKSGALGELEPTSANV